MTGNFIQKEYKLQSVVYKQHLKFFFEGFILSPTSNNKKPWNHIEKKKLDDIVVYLK